MKNKKRPYLWAVSYSVFLVIFTTYVILDTFVIPRSYSIAVPNSQGITNSSLSASTVNSVANDNKSSETSSVADSSQAETTENSYSDNNIKITINTYRENDTTIYVADVKLSSIDYLKTAFANSTYGKNVTAKTSEISQQNNAILAINGDFYGAQNRGYVIRNSVLYRDLASDNNEDLAIMSDGSFNIFSESDSSATDILQQGAKHVFSFGPGLLQNGNITVSENTEVGKAMTSNPRTAIGIIDKLHYIFVVADGRTTQSTGLSLYQLAGFMQGLGATSAYNLDGGGSSTMYFNGKVVNNPTTNGNSIQERSVSDIVYIGK